MNNNLIILMADDDLEDQMLARDALEEARVSNEVHFVNDGEDLMNYLYRRGKYAELADEPLPGMILLDLNMPRKDGREALNEIKNHPLFRTIPVIVLTTSEAETDILKTYNLGVNSYITKPVSFNGLVDVMKTLTNYWFHIVSLPPRSTKNDSR